MRTAQDFTGATFGHLLVLRRDWAKYKKKGPAYWICQCACGTVKSLRTPQYRKPGTSCGCSLGPYSRPTHGHTKSGAQSNTYNSWLKMLSRCTNAKDNAFVNYGARGITVCPRWTVFDLFLADMGERPEGKSLERIDNDGPYEPSNCRWATRAEQARNRRSNRWFLYRGQKMILQDVAALLGQTLRYHLLRGKKIEGLQEL